MTKNWHAVEDVHGNTCKKTMLKYSLASNLALMIDYQVWFQLCTQFSFIQLQLQ